MPEDTKKLDRSIKAIKVVVMDLKKKVGDLVKDVKNQEANLKKQNNQLQKLAEAVNAAVDLTKRKEQLVPEGFDPEKLKGLDTKINSEIDRLNQIEQKFEAVDQMLTALRKELQELQQRPEGIAPEKLKELDGKLESGTKRLSQVEQKYDDFDQTLADLREGLKGIHQQLEEIGPSTPADTTRLDQLEAEQGAMENKLTILRGKLVEIEETLGALKTATPTAPAVTETAQLNQIEKKLADFDQTLTSLRKGHQELHQRLEGLGALVPADTTRLDQLEAGQGEIENKIAVLSGKLAEIEESLGVLKAATPATPSIDMNEIIKRFKVLEDVISKMAHVPPATQPTSIPEPAPSPPVTSVVTPTPAAGTIKDKVRKIIEEMVTASAITIASRLQVSTAMIRGVLRELEEEGVVVLSGDIESGRFEVKLA
ncbi:MAG: hypothetical protein ACE5R6_01835 [Candidatus Heimdallarchaeota archaeon]